MKHLKFTIFTLFFILLLKPDIFSNDVISFPVKIDTVLLMGNEHTADNVILREIPYTLPDSLGEAELQEIQYRIQNLFLFNRVELHLTQFGSGMALIIAVTETWYFFPVPILFMNERDWGKISYGMQFSHFNFRGQNEKLIIGGWLGYNPSFYVRYLDPWLGRTKRLIFGFAVFHNRINNKIFDFDEKVSGIKLLLGKNFTLRLKAEFEIGLKSVRLPSEYKNYSASGNGGDIVPSLNYSIRYDKRDLYEYPRKGLYLSYQAERIGLLKNQPGLWRFTLDSRAYQTIYKKISVAGRNLFYVNRGDQPIYDRIYLGYAERIRGYFNRVFPALEDFRYYKSPEIMLNSFEVRFPLIPIKYFSYSKLPLLSTFSRDLKLGLSGGFFVDSGIIWQKTREIHPDRFFSGYGFGLHVHMPYINVFRIDCAWNDQGEQQFIFDAGVAF